MSTASIPSDLAQRRWDVVVIGAGPAGSMAARQLAQQGRRVLLVERAAFPRYKVCGGCLNHRALTLLNAASLENDVWRAGAQALDGFVLASRGRRANLALPGGAAVSRGVMDTMLAHAARAAGATFLEGCHAVVGRMAPEKVTVRLRMDSVETEIEAKAVVVGAGLASDVLRDIEGIKVDLAAAARIGAGTLVESQESFYEAGKIYMAVGRHGYVGLVRVEGGALNVAAAFDVSLVRECNSPALAAQRVLEEAGLSVPAELVGAAWRGTPPLTRHVRPVALHRILLVGDAAGYVEPFTGEGMAWALESGRAAAALVHRLLEHWDPAVAAEWNRTHARRFAGRHLRCRAIAGGLRRPFVVGAAIAALRVAPALARPLVRSLNAPPGAEEVSS